MTARAASVPPKPARASRRRRARPQRKRCRRRRRALSRPARDSIADLIAKAVDANRIDLYLQPIVTLPQRKVRYYEAVSRLRTEEGDVVPAGDFIEVAESVGLMPKIDNLAAVPLRAGDAPPAAEEP